MTETTLQAEDRRWQQILDSLLTQIDELPRLSNIVSDFLVLSRQEYSTASDFEKILAGDDALVAWLLKMANSGFFSVSREIKTIADAFVVIGMNNMKGLVYAICSEKLLRQKMKAYKYPGNGFWLHAMGVGVASRTIAESSPNCDFLGEESFVAGLLHDVSKRLMDSYFDPTPGPRHITIAEEIEVCGIDHCDLSRRIVESWRMPGSVRRAINFHHEPKQPDGWETGALAVNLADTLCGVWEVGHKHYMKLQNEVPAEAYLPSLEILEIPSKLAPRLLDRIRTMLDGLDEMLRSVR